MTTHVSSPPTAGYSWPMLFLLLALVSGCGPSEQDPSQGDSGPTDTTTGKAWFEDVTDASGISFGHDSTYSDRYLMPENVPGGAALFDMDNDGDLDLYFVQSGDVLAAPEDQPANQLYENLGDFTFRNITEGSGAGDRSFGNGVACGDFDNDGDIDLYVTNLGPNTLLRNEGGGVFTDVTDRAGVGHDGWGSSTAFLDYDRDGDLDLFVCNYLRWSIGVEMDCYNAMNQRDYCSPVNYDLPSADTLYRNNGDGTFTDVSTESGIDRAFGNGLGVVCSDFNDDGWIDIFVANDKNPDHLWVNQQDGTFLERALLSGCAVDQEGVSKAGMGVTVADIDFDGDPDLLVCNLAKESDSLYINENGFFTDGTIRSGLSSISRRFTRFGMGWADFDNDGLLDLYQANGRVAREERSYGENPYAEPNLLYRGLEGGRFEELQPRGGTIPLMARNSRAVVFGDVDNDGGMDLVVVNAMAESVNLLRNQVSADGHWLLLRVLESHGRDALGAKVSIRIGERNHKREVRSAYSYLAGNDPRVHFGLGAQIGATDLVVQWVDGSKERFGDLAADQIVTLRQGEGTMVD